MHIPSIQPRWATWVTHLQKQAQQGWLKTCHALKATGQRLQGLEHQAKAVAQGCRTACHRSLQTARDEFSKHMRRLKGSLKDSKSSVEATFQWVQVRKKLQALWQNRSKR